MYEVILSFFVFLSFLVTCVPARATVNQNYFVPGYTESDNSKVGNNLHENLIIPGHNIYKISFGNNNNKVFATDISLRLSNYNSDYRNRGQNLRIYSLVSNLRLQNGISGKFIPYVMSGVSGNGRSRNNMINGKSVGDVIYDLGIGTFVKITQQLLLDLNYKHVDFRSERVSNASYNQSFKSNTSSKELILNLVYKF